MFSFVRVDITECDGGIALGKYWVSVIAATHAGFAMDQGIAAFSKGKRSSVARVSRGDHFVYYSPKTGISEGDPVQAFTALGEITGDAEIEMPWADTGVMAWIKEASYEVIRPAPVKPMIEDLSFVTNPRYWGMAFRRGQFEISAEDFNRIAHAMRG